MIHFAVAMVIIVYLTAYVNGRMGPYGRVHARIRPVSSHVAPNSEISGKLKTGLQKGRDHLVQRFAMMPKAPRSLNARPLLEPFVAA